MTSGDAAATWKCPRCGRSFRAVNQRHSCGVGSREELLRNKPAALVTLYTALEQALAGYDDVEIVTKDRYALFRTTRIFADLVFMRDALRLAVHLKRSASQPMFFKVVAGRKGQVTHVTRLRTAAELRAVLPYMKEAYEAARDEARRRESP
jgi:predicted transport protein